MYRTIQDQVCLTPDLVDGGGWGQKEMTNRRDMRLSHGPTALLPPLCSLKVKLYINETVH
jgi:hypothetical protein